MESYTFPLQRTYGASQGARPQDMSPTDAHYATEHPQVPYQHPGYNLHYGYAVHPAYTQQTWEPVYLQAQPPSAYSFPLSPSASSASNIDHAPAVPIYAPVPVSPYSTLVSPTSPLSHAASDGVPAAQAAAESTVPLQKATSRQNTPEEVPPVVPARSAAANSNESKSTPVTAEQSPLEYYGNAPQVMFQTPSELLSELNASGSVGESSRKVAASGPSTSPTTAAPEPDSTKRSKGKTGSQAPAVPTTKPQTETQRKAYFRRVAEAVGFPPTDPDTITSHDKKRSYLECLEQYVQWLHDQIRLVGREPLPIERVQQYRGPSSRSIRTLLVHMQDEVRDLHQHTLQGERSYLNMQTQLQVQSAPVAAQQARRHSVAVCGLPDASLSSAPFLQPYHSHQSSGQGQYPQY